MNSNTIKTFFDIKVLEESSFHDRANMKEFLELLITAIDRADVNIRAALKKTSRKDLSLNIHSIKSNLRICGFVYLFHTSKHLELSLQNDSVIDVAEINTFLDNLQVAKTTCQNQLKTI